MLVGGSQVAATATWGALIVAVGIGLVGGMITAGAIARKVARERIFPFGLILSGVSVIIIASMKSVPPAIVATVFAGFGAGVAWVTIFTLLQERVDDRLRGRTFATLYTGVMLSLFVSLGGWPIIAGLIGNHHVDVGQYRLDLEGVRVVLWGGGPGVKPSRRCAPPSSERSTAGYEDCSSPRGRRGRFEPSAAARAPGC
ncbi:MAG: MFS transporter [Actinobacteria bacterium]|nr:MAG: MFS transporter [Actinomycetota bacterium]